MSDILLREMSNAEIDWLVLSGDRRRLKDNDTLIEANQPSDFLYLVLEGQLAINSPTNGSPITQLTRGDLVGENWLFDEATTASVTAPNSALVLAIPREGIASKLQQDISFAAHFYRTLALLLSEQIRTLFERSELLRYQSSQVVKEALFVFGELRDSDMDWMVSNGTVEKLHEGDILLHPGRPVDALYTVLDGQLVISTTDTPCDPLSACRHGLTEQSVEHQYSPTAHLSRGGLPGIISFLDFRPLPVRIHASTESLLLSIPRQKVVIKLQSDLSFAARFYRVIAAQMESLLTAVISTGKESMSDVSDLGADGELDLAELQQVCEGGAKFDWMLRRLGVGSR